MIESVVSEVARPMEPQPTGVEPSLPALSGISAVLFDVYGTLLISGSGDVGVASASAKPQALVEALAAASIGFAGDPEAGLEDLHECITEEHEALRRRGVDYPEVRITEIWSHVVERWVKRGESSGTPESDHTGESIKRLAIEYEMRINPVWPMPGLVETLDRLSGANLTLGIVSNAQMFTPLLFEPLTGRTLDGLGFVPDFCFWSYEHRRAKPGVFLYEQAADVLTACGLSPETTLYVGNDMRNDIWPASEVGFKTALYAGDARSLRLREDDEDVRGVVPDAVVTSVPEVGSLLLPPG